MAASNPTALRRGLVQEGDRQAYLRDGQPLGSGHIRSREALARAVGYLGSIIDVTQGARHWSALDPELLAARAAGDGYVLPPSYLALRLYGDDLILSNGPGKHVPQRQRVGEVADGTYKHRWVAAHHIGLSLSSSRDPLIYVSTLMPDTVQTAPVVIGVDPSSLGRLARLEYKEMSGQAKPHQFIDPHVLLGEQAGTPAGIATKAPVGLAA
ncbi:MAG TPA: hypothetical protein VF466_03565 [Candidatus Saccharimonadales bacterium]